MPLFDAHVHFGQYKERYWTPPQLARWARAVGMDRFAAVSTSAIVTDDPGLMAEERQALVDWSDCRGIPVLWITQSMLRKSPDFSMYIDENVAALKVHGASEPWAPMGKRLQRVFGIARERNLPIQLHTHYTSGVASMTYLKAVEAGVDVIDTAMSPFALGTSQPATEVMVETFKGTPYDTGFDQKLLAEIADYFRPIRDEALESGLLNPKNMGVNIKTLLYQVPGGMLSNLTSQLKEQHAEDKFYDVLEEVPRVRKDLGEPPLVTPSSQIVGTQAVFNVIMGERYKMVTKETKDILSGKYGATVKPFNPEVQKKCIGDTPVITHRPADDLAPELDKLEKEMAQWKEQDEDVLSYALFPQVATEFFKYREAQQTKVDPKAADEKNKAYPV